MRPLRDTTPDKIHLLSCRVRSSELLLVPEAKLNHCIGGIIAKYSELYDIKIYAFCILSNHYHILASSSDGKLALFAENANREITKRVNRLLKRHGSLWGRRYDDQIVLEAADDLEALVYILTNPVKHGLVCHPKLWPGLTSYWQALGAPPKTYSFLDYSEFTKAKRKAKLTGKYVRSSDYEKEYTLKISVLPQFEGLPKEEIKAKLSKAIEKRTRKLVRERREAGKGFLGRKAVLSQPRSGVFPEETNKTNRPTCYTKSLRALAEFKEALRLIRAAYIEASIKYRLGEEGVTFPPFCFFPPRHHVPKLMT